MDPEHGRRGCSAIGPYHHTSVSHVEMSCPSRCLTAVDTSFRRDPRGECPRSPGPARPHWPARGTHKCKFSAFLSELMECCWLTDREDRGDQDRKQSLSVKIGRVRKKENNGKKDSLLFAATTTTNKEDDHHGVFLFGAADPDPDTIIDQISYFRY